MKKLLCRLFGHRISFHLKLDGTYLFCERCGIRELIVDPRRLR